ncbi:hypothetical protein BBP40_008551 [Aspergillus hancockii]|nr:hypothetical protein BBP40_008551 [Aspergillus hancockii]
MFLALLCIYANAFHPRYKDSFTYDELWGLETSFWDSFMYPENQRQVKATDSSVFTEDVRGRLHFSRPFEGREVSNEYFFGSFSDLSRVGIVGIPIAYNITQFTANDNIASATTVVTFNSTTLGVLMPVTLDSWFKFSSQGKIHQYDITFRWLDFYMDELMAILTEYLNRASSKGTPITPVEYMAYTICEGHEEYCHGDDRQYSNHAECMDFLTTKLRYGQSYEGGLNTVICREIHVQMVRYRPKVHCPHLGPSGGGFCVDDRTYKKVVMEDFFKDSWIPYGYDKYQNVYIGP